MVAGSLNAFVSAVNKTGGAFDVLSELVEKSHDLLVRNAASLDFIFDNYELDKFCCLHGAALRAKYSSLSSVDKEVLLNQTEAFFNHCSAENLQKIPRLVRLISQEFINLLISLQMAKRGIPTMLIGIQKLQKSPKSLTSLHCDLCQLSLAAKIFNPILPILDYDILDVDRNNSAKDYLLYFYYGGMIYAALKKWERSQHFFGLCVIIPFASMSCILLEAAKKFILVSLIHNGKFTSISNAPTPYLMSSRPWKAYCRPYVELAMVYSSSNPEDLSGLVERYRDVFIADHNYGLVKQVLKSHIKFRIHSLTKTFMTMSLTDVSNRVKLSGYQEAEKYILDMIESKDIFAHIDQRDGTVHFLDDSEQYDSLEMLTTLQNKINQCVYLEKHLMEVSDELVKNPAYAMRMLELEAKTAKSTGQY